MKTNVAVTWGVVLAVLGSTAAPAPAGPGQAPRRKKLIATGWDHPDSDRLLANYRQMERRPFDGVVVHLSGRVDEKKRIPMGWSFTDRKWRREWFDPCIRNLKACKFRRFTDNFILVGANPGSVDWFDDAGWANIVEHWRIAAWTARQAGFKGLVFDPEPYNPPHAQFKYAAQAGRDKHAFAAYAAQARLRGRQVMQAVTAEFADITILCYFMNIAVSHAAGHADPAGVLAPHGYGLYPAFIDGWLDAAEPGATFVDGCEWAYRYNSVAEYLEAAVLIKGACQNLVSPENRAAYRAKVQVGFGVYLDAYWNPKDSKWAAWYVDGLGGPRVGRLRANVQTALRVADEYVWIYGEKFRWWPTPNRSVREQTWPDALGGCERALSFARDPVDYARSRLAELGKAGKLVNLARSGEFGSAGEPGRAPADWSVWQQAGSKGVLTWDPQAGAAAKGSARAAGAANGCFLQTCDVRPGECYAVGAACRARGKGRAWIRVRWQRSDGHWTAESLDRLILPVGPAGDWRELLGVVEVPAGAGKLAVLLCVEGQASPDDVAWFDDVHLHKLE